MNHIEDGIQKAIVDLIRWKYKHLTVFAIPNGGKRNIREAARMKGTGTLAGVADLCILYVPCGVAFMEVKAPKKYLSKVQKDFRDDCKDKIIPFALVRSIEDAENALTEWGIIP